MRNLILKFFFLIIVLLLFAKTYGQINIYNEAQRNSQNIQFQEIQRQQSQRNINNSSNNYYNYAEIARLRAEAERRAEETRAFEREKHKKYERDSTIIRHNFKNIVLKSSYTFWQDHDGIVLGSINNKWGALKINGKWPIGENDITGFEFDSIIPYNDFGFVVKNNNHFGFIQLDHSKKNFLPPEYNIPSIYEAIKLEDHFAKVKMNGKWGLVLLNGNKKDINRSYIILLPCIYDELTLGYNYGTDRFWIYEITSMKDGVLFKYKFTDLYDRKPSEFKQLKPKKKVIYRANN